MTHTIENNLDQWLREIRPLLDRHSDVEIQQAISTEDFSHLVHLPPDVRRSVAASKDLWTDIWWYVEIRHDIDIEDFPCVHIAYATSAKAKAVIKKSHRVFVVHIDEARTEGIVIGYCPWCAKPLNVHLFEDDQ